MTIAAGACYLGAFGTLVVGWRDGVAEVAILGAELMAQCGLAVVHGLSAPGVLYGNNAAVSASVFVALPLALAVALPLVSPDVGASRWVARRWKGWASGWVVAGAGLAGWLLVAPNALPEPSLGKPVAVSVGIGCLAVALRLSWRQLELYWIGQRAASLVASLSLAFMGLTGLVWIARGAFGPGWWFAHLLDVTAVLGASVALAVGYRQDKRVTDLLAPVLARKPLVALRFGVELARPPPRRGSAGEDPLTRDHVVRVAELAMRAGQRGGLSPVRLRSLGLGAILHDIGRVETPNEILTKPGRLTESETTMMRQHALVGERLLGAVPELAPAARFVRAHHERVDGAGYPDGLRGDQIPLEAGIISVCDAFDAMAHTRHYRTGMGPELAIAILREHAGSQWDAACVELVVAEVLAAPAGTVLWDVGTAEPASSDAAICHASSSPG